MSRGTRMWRLCTNSEWSSFDSVRRNSCFHLVVKPQYNLMGCLKNTVERERYHTINNIRGLIIASCEIGKWPVEFICGAKSQCFCLKSEREWVSVSKVPMNTKPVLLSLVQHNPSRVLCWVVFEGPVPGLYQINLDQRLCLIIMFLYLSAFFFFLSNSTKQSRGFKLWKTFVEMEQWKLFQPGLLSPNMQMSGEHGGTAPGPELAPRIAHTLLADVVQVWSHNWDEWLHRELSVETWSQEALSHPQSTCWWATGPYPKLGFVSARSQAIGHWSGLGSL